MLTNIFNEDGAGGTIADAQWQRINLAAWTLQAGSVANLVTAVDSTNVTIDDLTANTGFADWSLFRGPALEAGYMYMLRLAKTNQGANDRAGLYVGFRDANDDVPQICGGPFETTSGDKVFVSRAAGSITSQGNICTYAIADLQLDVNKNMLSGGVIGFGSGGGSVGSRVASMGIATSPEMAVWVEHGLTGVGAPSVYGYELYVRRIRLTR